MPLTTTTWVKSWALNLRVFLFWFSFSVKFNSQLTPHACGAVLHILVIKKNMLIELLSVGSGRAYDSGRGYDSRGHDPSSRGYDPSFSRPRLSSDGSWDRSNTGHSFGADNNWRSKNDEDGSGWRVSGQRSPDKTERWRGLSVCEEIVFV